MNKSKPTQKRWWIWLIVLAVVLAAGAAAVVYLPAILGPGASANVAPAATGTVTTITAVSSVEASGAVAARQTASVSWQTTGQVAEVAVQIGDHVNKGDVLMTLDTGSASASFIQAESELLDAQAALEALLNPSAVDIAHAQQAVSDAEGALETAQKELRNLAQPNIAYYEDQVAAARADLVTAQQNAEVNNIGNLATALQNAQEDLETKTNWYNDAQTAQAQCPGCTTVFVNSAGRKMSLADAEQAYNASVNAYRIAEVNYQQGQGNSQDSVDSAQEALDDALANLAWAKAGADADDLAAKQNAVAVAEANLAEARQTFDELLHGADPAAVRKAELRVAAAQASLDGLTLRAPIAGEVLVINDLPGDSVSQSEVAVLLADRSQIHVEVSIDESDISQVALGDPVELTFDAVPGLTLPATVGYINPVGEAVQGLVKYTVRVDAATTDPRVLLGMTGSARIVTDVQEGTLAVPVEAVQLDDQGEYVLRVNLLGAAERVSVVSGAVLDTASAGTDTDVVIVTGDLQPGDTVQLVAQEPTSNGGFFGGPGGPP